MAKKLSDSLRPASFRGVPFQVDCTDMGVGRRTQLHEYPQRDKPYVEDLGRATRELSFDGFVVGADYVDQVNKLLAALEKPGPGTLIHPWLGTLTVSLKDTARVSFNAALGQARVSISLIESGELEFPTAKTSTQAQSRIAAGKLEAASVASFASKFNIQGFQDFVAAAASGNLGNLLGIVSGGQLGAILGYANSLAKTISTVITFIRNPASLGWMILGALGLSGVATTVAAWSNIVRALSRLGKSDSLAAPPVPMVYTRSRQQAYTNAVAASALVRQALIAQAVGASSLVGTAADKKQATGTLSLAGAAASSSGSTGSSGGGGSSTQTSGSSGSSSSTQAVGSSIQAGTAPDSTPRISHTDMMAVRDELIAAIDQEALTATDEVYVALMEARGAVWNDLTTRARDNARLTTLTPPETMPALVLAYDYYEDATRASDIVARNGIRHPGFVPPIPLKVLTR
jgi:prophage DNA circulation protein